MLNQKYAWYPTITHYKNLRDIDFDWFIFRISYNY